MINETVLQYIHYQENYSVSDAKVLTHQTNIVNFTYKLVHCFQNSVSCIFFTSEYHINLFLI